ncbi:hypothetical protein GX48_07373 [Paracoccidioides brasiliensis]|nr:hypothetical protein GX48_07373 [Paracoccidioides brasiliensis]
MEKTVDPRPLLKSVSEGGCPDDYRDESVQAEQTPGSAKKRKRAVLTTSCELCRQRKVRCDRGEPSCGWCTRNGRECVYRDKMLPTFRVLHIRELELKVNTLEAMLDMLGRRLELHISEHETAWGSRQPPPPDQVVADQQGFATASEPRRSDLSETLSQDPTASIVEAASERVQRSRPSALISVQPLVNVNAMEGASEPASSDMIESSLEGVRETMSELHLPSRDTLYVIVDLFFKHVNPWCPILERAATVEKVFRAPVCDEADLVLLYAIVRVTLKFYKNPGLTHSWRETFPAISKQKILLYAFEHTSISALQALTILALDLLGMSYGPQSCTLLSMIVRNVMQLGLGVETTVALGQPSHESPGTLHQFMLPPSTPWKPDVLRILNRIHKFLRTPIDIGCSVDVDNWQATFRDLDRELDRWLYNLPDDYGRISQLCHSSPTSRISSWIMLHAAFITCVLRLHTCAAYPTIRSQMFFPSFAAMQRCLAAVESLREIVQDVVNTGMLDLLGPHFALSLWVSARVLVVDASVSNTDVNSIHWGMAKKYAKVLENILEEDQEAKRVAAMIQDTASSSQSPPLLEPKSLAEMRVYASSSLDKRVQLIHLHRSAYELSIILFQRYSSGVHPPSVKTVTPSELEYYEVFDFFNYPRPPVPVAHQASSLTTNTGLEPPASNGAEGWTRVKTHIVSTTFTYLRSDSEFQSPRG